MKHKNHPTVKFQSFLHMGMLKKSIVTIILVFGIVGTCIYQTNLPPPPRMCGLPGGPPITSPRVKLRDGRFLAYKVTGVPKSDAKVKVVFVHGFGNSRHDVVVAAYLPREVFRELGLHIVSFDRPGYGESDPDPKRSLQSMALDIENLADELKLGKKFYIIGFSMGGQTVWGCLKYIPHRLAGAALLAPVVNYWWSGFPARLSNKAFKRQPLEDQWAQRIVHYIPSLTYWWNTQKIFPGSSVASGRAVLSRSDLKLIPKIAALGSKHWRQVKQQGEYESIHRDMMIGFGSWEFSPLNLTNPFQSKQGSVHLWQGDEDTLVPVMLQRYIAQKLPWIKYHEVKGGGHLFPFFEGMNEDILRKLLASDK